MAIFAIVNEPDTPDRKERFANFPWWAQTIIAYPSIWEVWLPGIPALWGLWMLLLFFGTGSIALLILAFIGLGVAGAYIALGLETIREDKDGKPQFGLLEVLGMRLPIVFNEGLALKIPFVSRIVRRSKEQFNEDLTIGDIKCRLTPMAASTKKTARAKSNTFYWHVARALNTPSPANIESGGTVEVKLGLTFERDWMDGWAVLEYDDIGETKGFLEISQDAIEADLREIGRRLTWLQATFATDLMSAHLIMKLTGETHFDDSEILTNPTPEGIGAFLDDVRINGRSYIRGLGIKIRRIEVKNVTPVGKLKDASENAAVEEMRRMGLLKNVDALSDAVEKLKGRLNDGSLEDKDYVNIIQVDEEGSRVTKEIKEWNSDGIDKIAGALKTIVENWSKK